MTKSSRGSICILHVDDEPDFAEMAADFLEREDERFVIETATSATEELDQLVDDEYDCVISDYDMPGQNGIEFLETVRAEYPDLPFILYTGKGSEEVASEVISAGVTDYIQKESGTDQYTVLANRITNAVERARATQARERQLKAIETAREGISILDEDGQFIYVNEAYADLYGYDPEEMVGDHWELIYPDDEVSFARQEILPTVAREGYWHGETTGLCADGSTFPEDHVVSETAHGNLVCTVRDLSDRREREAELHWKTRAMDEAPVGITVTDPTQEDNPMIYANEQFVRLTGYDREEIIGRNCRFLQGENTDPDPVEAMSRAIDNRESVMVELRNYRKDGSEFWNRVTIAPLLDAEGNPTNWVGFQEDVTDRKEREQNLHRYKRMVNTMQEAACIYDEEGRFAVVNEYLADFYGTTQSALVGEKSNLIPHIRAQHAGDPYQELLAGERSEIHGEIEGEFPGHGYEVLAYRLTPLVIDGEIDGVVGVAHEVTHHKERERELKQYETIIETIDDGVYVVDEDSRFVMVNDAYAEMFGYEREELVGAPVSLIADEKNAEEAQQLEAAMRRGTVDAPTIEAELPTANGDRLSLEARFALLPGPDDQEYRVGVVRDISERKTREEELQRQNERLEEFASIVSHDLRNPLTIVEGQLELARTECDSEHLDSAENALNRAQELIDDLLTLAREGNQVDDLQPVSLVDTIEGCWKTVETTEATLRAETDRTIRADQSRLKQLLENLIRNAVEHGGEDVTVTVGNLEDGFYVADDGPGIPEDEREQVFEAGHSTSENGTGFGLAIVKQITEAHGWDVRVTDSEVGGARFEISGVEFDQR
jgi:PAS domain S-box-containing protein